MYHDFLHFQKVIPRFKNCVFFNEKRNIEGKNIISIIILDFVLYKYINDNVIN